MTEAAVAAQAVGDEEGGGQQASRNRRALSLWDDPAARRRLVLGLIAALPILIGAIVDAAHGWVPVFDYASTLVRARDVFSLHTPLIGQHTQAGHYIGQPVYTPGPIMYWLFALPTLVIQWWPAAPLIWSALFQTVVVFAIVWLADRIGGRSLSVITAIGILLLCVPSGARELYTIWNPYIAMLPLLLLAFVTAEILLGRYQLLWLAALLATFVVQTYLTLAPAALLLSAMVAVAVGVVLVRWLRGRRQTPLPAGLRRGSFVATGIILFVCWLPPVVQQLKDPPGNLRLLWDTARANPTNVIPSYSYESLAHVQRVPRVGMSSALIILAKLVPMWPWRLVQRQIALDATLAGPSGTFGKVLGVITLIAMASVVAVAWRRHQRDIAALSAAALALLVGAVLTAASEPTGPLSIDNWWGLVWVDVAATLAWVSVVWALWRLLRPVVAARFRSAPRISGRRATAATLTGAVGLLVASLLVAIPGQQADSNAWVYPFVRRATAAVLHNGRGPYEVVPTGISAVATAAGPGLLLALRARSVAVGVAGSFSVMVGAQYRLPPGTRGAVIVPMEANTGASGAKRSGQTILAMPVDLIERGRRVTAVINVHPRGP